MTTESSLPTRRVSVGLGEFLSALYHPSELGYLVYATIKMQPYRAYLQSQITYEIFLLKIQEILITYGGVETTVRGNILHGSVRDVDFKIYVSNHLVVEGETSSSSFADPLVRWVRYEKDADLEHWKDAKKGPD